MNDKQEQRFSRFLSLVLRHKPEEIDITLDKAGWTNIAVLIKKCKSRYIVSRQDIEQVVQNDTKGRYSISDDGLYIRANQGHSVKVDLGYNEKEPPEFLFHGTATRFLDSIMKHGLNAMKRHAVHLSDDRETAVSVGERHGDPIVLIVAAKWMYELGYKFHISANGVWLTQNVLPEFLSLEQ